MQIFFGGLTLAFSFCRDVAVVEGMLDIQSLQQQIQ
jgi:hypothetical protein